MRAFHYDTSRLTMTVPYSSPNNGCVLWYECLKYQYKTTNIFGRSYVSCIYISFHYIYAVSSFSNFWIFFCFIIPIVSLLCFLSLVRVYTLLRHGVRDSKGNWTLHGICQVSIIRVGVVDSTKKGVWQLRRGASHLLERSIRASRRLP